MAVAAPSSSRKTAARSTYDVEPGTELDVVTPVARARALGTRFRVEVETMDRTTLKKGAIGAALVTAAVVIVYEGHVLLSNEHGEVDVGPGQSARAEAGRAPEPVTQARSTGGARAGPCGASAQAGSERTNGPADRD